MSPKKDTQKSKGFTDEEKAAMKERAKELKAEERANKDRAAGESDLLAAIAKMKEPDRSMAKRLHEIVTAARQLSCRKHGMGCLRMPARMARSYVFFRLRVSLT